MLTLARVFRLCRHHKIDPLDFTAEHGTRNAYPAHLVSDFLGCEVHA